METHTRQIIKTLVLDPNFIKARVLLFYFISAYRPNQIKISEALSL